MQLFYHPGLCEGINILTAEESYHAAKVLRMRPGDTLYLTDGQGRLAQGRVLECSTRKTCIEVSQLPQPEPRPQLQVHIAIAPVKSPDRFEFFVEKAVELGVSTIIPLVTAKSERHNIKTERLERIIIAAMKQSLGVYLPILRPVTAFKDFVSAIPAGTKAIAHCHYPVSRLIHQLAPFNGDVTIAIGPEGDFSPEEVEMALRNGFVEISLGTNRLRTETAGIVAAMIPGLIKQ